MNQSALFHAAEPQLFRKSKDRFDTIGVENDTQQLKRFWRVTRDFHCCLSMIPIFVVCFQRDNVQER